MSENHEERDAEAVLGFTEFASAVLSYIKPTPFHSTYYRVLERFARGDIRKLIVSVPPQHGKSLGASILLPAYILGQNPDCKIAIASYNATLASRFNKRVQRILDSEKYIALFPDTRIKPPGGKSEYVRTSTQTEIIGRSGELFSVGREGSLTGNEVDLFILDDLYKDAMEANSPVVRENCWEWYTSVVRTRLHNDSSELIVFTRWHEDDLIGKILAKEPHTLLREWGDIDTLPPQRWLVVNFEALKEGLPTEIDPRDEGEALWPQKHSRTLLLEKRALDAARFDCMFQGRPSHPGGLLYGSDFRTYNAISEEIVRKGCYVDTADLGDDYLCAVCYDIGLSGTIYITDVVYSRERMEVTERLVADMLVHCETRIAFVESNNGGRGFARAVSALARHVRLEWFHQSGNKEARILTNSATVIHCLRMPSDWAARWPEFHNHLVTYRRLFASNRWHDAPDVLTGIVEREVSGMAEKKLKVFK
ncbi:MAG: phage terminase large subunit [Rikenellaceae bacterium]|nr:phage terminase large subunit [Rikenellaceae bacterium]MCL2692167.1 phage terminase large subunit [Rikenellaceae bacterium]